MIIYHRDYADDLDKIGGSDSFKRSLSYMIDSKLENISIFPESHAIYPFRTPRRYQWRWMLVKSYYVFYYVDGSDIHVGRILYCRMNVDKIIESYRVNVKRHYFVHAQ